MKTEQQTSNKLGAKLSWSVLFILGAIILCITLIPLYFGNAEGWNPDKPQFFVQYAGVIISSISLIAVAITLRYQSAEISIQREQLTKNFKISEETYNSLILNLIKELQSESTEQTRRKASCFREYLRSNTNKQQLEVIFNHVISDDWGTSEEYRKIMETDFYQQFHAFTTLARYFDTMSYYEFNEMTAKSVHFYYVWWREAFLIYNEIYYKVHKKSTNRHFSFIPNWITMVERMDKNMTDFNLQLS